MKKLIVFFTSMAFTWGLFSFSEVPTTTIRYGKFGGDGFTAPQLELNEDHTFHYIDNTNKHSPINFSGTWEIVENDVYLLGVNKQHVMDKLTIMREGKCLKARKGMAFYTLCNC